MGNFKAFKRGVCKDCGEKIKPGEVIFDVRSASMDVVMYSHLICYGGKRERSEAGKLQEAPGHSVPAQEPGCYRGDDSGNL